MMHLRAFTFALLAVTSPAWADMVCVIEIACHSKGECTNEMNDETVRIMRSSDGIFVSDDEPNADVQEMRALDVDPRKPEIFLWHDPGRGDAQLMTLYPDGHFILSAHATVFEKLGGLMVQGKCEEAEK